MPSVWQGVAPATRFPRLDRDLAVDVAIVGGGITGVLCAERLTKEGAKAAVLDSRTIGGGSTGNSTGNLYALVGERHGRLDNDRVRDVLAARAAGVDLIEALVREYAIDCGFVRCPWTMYATSNDGANALARAAELARDGGLATARSTPPLPFAVADAVSVEAQAQFNPALFTQGLAKRIADAGVGVFEGTRMQMLDADRMIVHTESGDVRCKSVVLATHTPKGRLRVHAEMGVFREYGVAATIGSAALPPGIFWSAEMPNRSLRSYRHDGRDYVVVVGENHRTGDREDTLACMQELESFLRRHFGVTRIAYRWSAQNYRPADGLPFIGPSALGEHVLVATGYAADGLTYAAVAARILADRIAGRKHALAEAFDPRRLTLGKELWSETIQTLKEFVRDFPGAANADLASIPAGAGSIVDSGGEKLAVHRDHDGALHAVSAVCTHMQCIVRWNNAEHSWDCPCHGSRFEPDGTVIEGPALADLSARRVPA